MADKNEIAVSVFNSLAQPYADKYMDVSQYLPSINSLMDAIPENATLLELGCGPGNLTKQFISLRPDLKITATDLAPDMLAIAQEMNPTTKTLLLDCRNTTVLNEKFDCVVIGFVLPYLGLTEVKQLIKDSFDLLNPHGKIYLSTMVGNPKNSAWKRGTNMDVPKVFMHYYTKAQLEEMLTINHLHISHAQQYDIENAEEKDLILIATKI
jgi:2-polyprenyl-3-methyl-5-hydroxy-6-metoxy-1,4-benzoquinol methylase